MKNIKYLIICTGFLLNIYSCGKNNEGVTNSAGSAPAENKIDENKLTEINGNISNLKDEMSFLFNDADAKLAFAATLKVKSVMVEEQIKDEDCEIIAGKISANYPLNPFKATYDSGALTFSVCNDGDGLTASQRWWKIYYKENVEVYNQFHVKGSRVLQQVIESTYPSEQIVNSLILDENFKIIEITSTKRYKKDTEPYFFNVMTLDAQGNYFSNNYYGSIYKDKNSFETHQKFISKDGDLSFARNLNLRRSDKGNEPVLVKNYTYSAPKDWDAFYLIITYAWSGGLYKYPTKVKNNSIVYKDLSIYTVNGSEVCADGFASTKTSFITYNSPTATSGICFNDW